MGTTIAAVTDATHHLEAKGQLKMAVGASIAAVGCDLAGNRSLQSNQRQSRILWKVKDPVTKDATLDMPIRRLGIDKRRRRCRRQRGGDRLRGGGRLAMDGMGVGAGCGRTAGCGRDTGALLEAEGPPASRAHGPPAAGGRKAAASWIEAGGPRPSQADGERWVAG